MRKFFLSASFVLFYFCVVNAQIKVVGDDYKESLSGTKNTYSFDVDFDKLFPVRDAREYYGWLDKNMSFRDNIIGDTIWIPFTYESWIKSIEVLNSETNKKENKEYIYSEAWTGGRDVSNNIGRYGFVIATDGNGKEHWEYYPPAGYYEITGYVFCQDNASQLIERHFNGIDNPFSSNKNTIKQLKTDIVNNRVTLSDYLFYIKLSSINDINGNHYDYYVRQSPDLLLFDLKYYNIIKNHFLGKEVCLRGGAKNGKIKDSNENETGNLGIEVSAKKDNVYARIPSDDTDGLIIKDIITRDDVKLVDSTYLIKDVVVKIIEGSKYGIGPKKKDVALYCILEGTNTGSFSLEIENIQYNYRLSGDDGETYIHPYYQKKLDYPYLTWRLWYLSDRISDNYYDIKHAIVCLDDFKEVLADVADSINVKKNKDIAKREAEESVRKQAEEEYRRKELEEKLAFEQMIIEKYGTKMGNLVINHQVSIGMSKEMVRDAWGRPMDTYRTTTRFGQSEVWCYNYKTIIYFYDGKVVQIDD